MHVQASLAEVVRQQPYLVTASIDRNMEIASLLRDTLQLRPSQMHGLVARCPQVSRPVMPLAASICILCVSLFP